MVPSRPSTKAAAAVAYGVSWAARPSGPEDETRAQAVASFVPTRGRPATHVGGGGSSAVANLCAIAVTLSTEPTTVATTAHSGTISSSSIARVITATAGPRRWKRASSLRKSGQVETTTVVAQTSAARNGRRTYSDATINSSRQSTPSVSRVRSGRAEGATDGGASGRGWDGIVMGDLVSWGCHPPAVGSYPAHGCGRGARMRDGRGPPSIGPWSH